MYSIKKGHILLGLYIFVNLIYVAYYGFDLIPQSVYYAALAMFCAVCMIFALSKNNWLFSLDMLKSGRIFKNVGGYLLAILLISWWKQLLNRNFEIYTIRYLIQILLPMLCAVGIIECDEDNLDSYIYILFARCIAVFANKFGEYFSITNLLSISLADSNSSLMENSMAHPFLLITIYFLYKKKYIQAIISSILCIACFKRFCVAYLFLSWMIFRWIPHRKVDGEIRVGIKIAFILVPFFMSWLYSTAGAQWFESVFHTDLDDFVSSRYSLAVMVQDHFQGNFNGFGSIKNFFATSSPYWAIIKAIHCDFLELYWECSIVGVGIYVNNVINLAREDYRMLYMVCYILVEVMVGFMMSAYAEWMICYFFIYEISKEKLSS